MKQTFKEFLAEEKEVVKNTLYYEDMGPKDIMKIHIGENNGRFFIVLKSAHANHHLSKIMFRHRDGSDGAAKRITAAIKKTWDKVKDKGTKQRALALRTTLNDASDIDTWRIEK